MGRRKPAIFGELMAKLTTKKRKALPRQEFAEPGKRAYPIHDESHARNALSRVSQYGSPSEQKQVRAAVRRKYQGMSHRGI